MLPLAVNVTDWPSQILSNPVMFTVEIGTAIMLVVCIGIFQGDHTEGTLAYNFTVFIVLLLTLLFANFAEAIAEARGKAQANSLRKTREETPAKWINPMGEMYVDELTIVPSSQLKKGDKFLCEAGDIIPTDGEIIEGIAKIFNEDAKYLHKQYISDQIAYKIIDEEADLDTLKVAERKIEYLKSNRQK